MSDAENTAPTAEENVVVTAENTGATETTPPSEAEAKQEPQKPPKGYVPVAVMQRRLDQMTAEKARLREENETLKQLSTVKKDGVENGKGMTQAELDAWYAARRQAELFEDKVYNVGKAAGEKNPEFLNEWLQMTQVTGMSDDVLQDIVDFDNAVDIVSILANDIDKAAEIVALPVNKRAIALAKLSVGLAKQEAPKQQPTRTSKAPEPIKPLETGAGAAAIDESRISFAELARLKAKS